MFIQPWNVLESIKTHRMQQPGHFQGDYIQIQKLRALGFITGLWAIKMIKEQIW